MKGNNKLYLNAATVIAALEEYFTKRAVNNVPPFTVTRVEWDKDPAYGGLVVYTAEIEPYAEAEGTK